MDGSFPRVVFPNEQLRRSCMNGDTLLVELLGPRTCRNQVKLTHRPCSCVYLPNTTRGVRRAFGELLLRARKVEELLIICMPLFVLPPNATLRLRSPA